MYEQSEVYKWVPESKQVKVGMFVCGHSVKGNLSPAKTPILDTAILNFDHLFCFLYEYFFSKSMRNIF